MKFEDLFKEGPSNYVETPPKKVATLEEFFKERTPAPVAKPKPNMFGGSLVPTAAEMAEAKAKIASEPKEVVKPVSDEVAEIAKSSEPVSDRVEEIKQSIFSQVAPEVQQPQPQQAALPEFKSQIGWGDAALGLLPLVTDALTGGTGAGTKVASQYLGDTMKKEDERKKTFEAKLLEIAKARELASAKGISKRFQSVNIVDPATLQIIKANYDTSTGQYSLPDGRPLNSEKIRAGYAVIPEESDRRVDYKPIKNPETGLPSRIVGGELVPIGTQTRELNPQQVKDLDNVVKQFTTTDAYKKNALTIQTASTIDSLLDAANSGNPAAAEMARSEIAKMAEGGGRLSDQDVARVGGSQSFKAKARRFANLQKTDLPLTQKDIADLKEVARIIKNAAKAKLNQSIGSLEQEFLMKGGKKGAVQKAMASKVPGLYDVEQPEPQKPKSGKVPPPGMTFEQFKKWKQQNG